MNKLDTLLNDLVLRHAMNLGLKDQMAKQMAKEISICAVQGYNSRAELIGLIKQAIATSGERVSA